MKNKISSRISGHWVMSVISFGSEHRQTNEQQRVTVWVAGWQVTVTTLQHRRAGGVDGEYLTFFRTVTIAKEIEVGQVTPRAPAAAGDRRQANIVTHWHPHMARSTAR